MGAKKSFLNNVLSFERNKKTSESLRELVEKLSAINDTQAVIEFAMDGTILDANENFLKAMGYMLSEVKGHKHAMFVDASYRDSEEYRQFWDKLQAGETLNAEYKRLGKDGKEVWIRASYNPIYDTKGRPYKVVKYAIDVTADKLRNADYQGQIDAIGKSQAVIEFNMDGTIRNANQNFLSTLGYTLDEIKGKHHSMFVPEQERNSMAYKEFWDRLRAGEFFVNEFKRIGKGGKEIWIHASYNPILDMNGTPFKVVKYATDVTEEKLRNADYQGQIDAIGRSQAVIEFNMDGTIRNANQNFLSTLGYTLDEIKGHHHSMFVDEKEKNTPEYRQFWSRLQSGEFFVDEFKRIGKGGKEIWIQASYNPIFDMSGKPFKVVKYASDITGKVHAKKEAADMMGTSAVATEQLNASIHEISKNMSQAKTKTENMSDVSGQADESSLKLTNASANMSGVLALINDIADQINLLALNATIEAARAGEAGKGFAVVASEVKNLAMQTKEATEKIEREINEMQIISTAVVDNLNTIKDSVQEVLDYVVSTSASVEEQSMVAQELSSSVQNISSFINNL